MKCLVHADDFMSTGTRTAVKQFSDALAKIFEIKRTVKVANR